jgi:hypothetical protein
MLSPASAGDVHGLGDNDDEASLWEVLVVLGVVASRFFYVRTIYRTPLMWYSRQVRLCFSFDILHGAGVSSSRYQFERPP